MNFFEINKAFGALLLALLFIMVTGMVTSFIFSEDLPETPGYAIEVASADAGGASAAPKEEEETVDFATLLASADVAKGQKIAKKCAACHTFDEGGKNKVGPNLFGIVGRSPASVDGFKYSNAMTEFAANNSWDVETLNNFVTKLKELVKGTSMAFAGLKKDKDRANLIGYLQSLSN